MAWERRHPCLHAFVYCGQDGRAPGHIFIIVCERVLMVSAPKMAWERRHPCLHAFIYCNQDGRTPGYIFIIVCERALMVSALKIPPGSAGISACMLSSTAARMAALPGTFSSSYVSAAHDNCSENTPWERRHPCLHDFMYCGQDGRAPGHILIIVGELGS